MAELGFLDLFDLLGHDAGERRRAVVTFSSSDLAELETLVGEVQRTRPHTARLLRRLLKKAVRLAHEDLLTTSEAALELGVSDQTVRNWADRGRLPFHRLHRFGRRMIPRSAIADVRAFNAVTLTPATPMTEEKAVESVRRHRRTKP